MKQASVGRLAIGALAGIAGVGLLLGLASLFFDGRQGNGLYMMGLMAGIIATGRAAALVPFSVAWRRSRVVTPLDAVAFVA